jgi:hypothetical protein
MSSRCQPLCTIRCRLFFTDGLPSVEVEFLSGLYLLSTEDRLPERFPWGNPGAATDYLHPSETVRLAQTTGPTNGHVGGVSESGRRRFLQRSGQTEPD